jgi:hypothetical protein
MRALHAAVSNDDTGGPRHDATDLGMAANASTTTQLDAATLAIGRRIKHVVNDGHLLLWDLYVDELGMFDGTAVSEVPGEPRCSAI